MGLFYFVVHKAFVVPVRWLKIDVFCGYRIQCYPQIMTFCQTLSNKLQGSLYFRLKEK